MGETLTFAQWWEAQDYELQSQALGFPSEEIETRKMWASTGYHARDAEVDALAAQLAAAERVGFAKALTEVDQWAQTDIALAIFSPNELKPIRTAVAAIRAEHATPRAAQREGERNADGE